MVIERRGMYRCVIEDGYLHYEGDLTEWERKRQWEELDRLIDEMIEDYEKSVFERRKRKLRTDEICLTNKTESPSEPAGVKATRIEYGKDQ